VTHAARIGAGGETRVVLEAERGVDLREKVFQEAVTRAWTLLELTPKQASLEDVFVRLLSVEQPPDTDVLPVAVEATDPSVSALSGEEKR
jgi:hypothetical protein